MARSYIGADVDSKMVDLAVERGQKICRRMRVPLSIPSLRAALQSVPGEKWLTFEEGPAAQWLFDNLRDCVDRLVVCDPYRNGLISSDGDADDVVDAGKLAELLRGGYLREVHHEIDQDMLQLRHFVWLYHDRVREAVRQVNKMRGCGWKFGARLPRGVLRQPQVRQAWVREMGEDHLLVRQMQVLWIGYDAVRKQVDLARREMMRLAKKYPIVEYWQDLPGVGVVRAITLLACLVTPWRFGNNPKKLWKYCGVGLERAGSGKDRDGKPKQGRLHLAWRVNRRLKNVVMGMAISAIRQGNNEFADLYERLVSHGLTHGNARHAVARKMLTVCWGMWKRNEPFDPALIGPAEAARATTQPQPRRRRH